MSLRGQAGCWRGCRIHPIFWKFFGRFTASGSFPDFPALPRDKLKVLDLLWDLPHTPLVMPADILHVLPVNDLQAHEETRDCWCTPDCTREPYEEGPVVVVHHAMDGRELVEQHGVQ